MRYLDVCSGISAPTMAWKPLGWQALCFAEIEAAPRAVLAHHYPDVPLVGDFTKIRGDEYGSVDLLVGGTPCQSFSIAGLRGGLADERGNLALEYLRLADRARPRWLVWENVPGVLSSDGGRDFGTFLGGLAQLGYGFAYAVLDAQHFGVPQRRRRVFVVGHLGDWRRAAAVLFERHSLSRDTPPRRETGERVAPCLEAGANRTGGPRPPGTTVDTAESLIHVDASNSDEPAVRFALADSGSVVSSTGEIAHCLNAGGMGRQDYETETLIAFAQNSRDEVRIFGGDGQTVGALAAEPGMKQQSYAVPLLEIGKGTTSRGVGPNGSGLGNDGDPMFTLQAGAQHGVGTTSAVRRLTPRECERLQGFPDDFTLVPYRKGMMADGPRYKMLGNSMAVPVIRWIGERIARVDGLPLAERLAA